MKSISYLMPKLNLSNTNRCIHVANHVGGTHRSTREDGNRIYLPDGICPTICARYGNWAGFKILIIEDEQSVTKNTD